MQVSISVRHGQLAESTQTKLKSKAEKLSRYFDRLMAIELVIDLQEEHHPSVEIMVSAEHKHDFVATGKSENLISATDAAVQKIEQQLRKYKEKVQQKHRNSQRDSQRGNTEVVTESESQEDLAD
ncbi:MAG: ribosome hibernation-promoting factor, HPF/YfiA family [Bythopirellula sp.]